MNRSLRKDTNSVNFSFVKKRRQSYLRTPTIQEEMDEEIQALTGNEISLLEEPECDEKLVPAIEQVSTVSEDPEDSVESLIELWFSA